MTWRGSLSHSPSLNSLALKDSLRHGILLGKAPKRLGWLGSIYLYLLLRIHRCKCSELGQKLAPFYIACRRLQPCEKGSLLWG